MSGVLARGAARVVEVLAPGPYATVQDLGRPGLAHLGVPCSGAADADALRLANRLVGNPEGLAGIELTFGGARLAFHAGAWVAVTGAGCPLSAVPLDAKATAAAGTSGTAVPGEGPPGTAAPGEGASSAAAPGGAGWRAPAAGAGVPFWVPAGTELRFGTPAWGLRSYLAVRGGVAVEPVLGSRSTDSLSGLGPEPLRAGTVLPVGPVTGLEPIVADVAPPRGPRPAVLRVLPGPRDDWFAPGALAELCAEPYTVSQDSNRVGVRLGGRELARAREGELPSEGMVAGALQVPPSGQPIVFLADHPPTGGYPVIAVLVAADLPVAAQLRPGDRVRFTTHRRA
ncbi:biotin-dependent carboxyltransferase family protein [Nonomuraea roseoviolacea]|uniref:Allophanate hydrolase subunit 2 n=1 Tax=Nonomuraea roseoviolacea subsp. carminata TaxID=160689 RepID=A0ABT1K6Q4_9ACTN|nr:biotin-dependent carboxyltransferase family protein [Nonomuraea roseoviolacea]MCP2349670.1 allophanate hydrolase subunit 2 [Nonomuraea roseoviolacea subsp. carminata]